MALTSIIRGTRISLAVGLIAVAGLAAGHASSLVVPVVSTVLGAATPAEAGPQDFTLTNALPGTITQLFVGESSNPNWGPNVLSGAIPTGASAPVTFDGFPEASCTFDVRIEVDGATTWDVMGIDLCATHALTFVPNEAGGVNYVVTPAN